MRIPLWLLAAGGLAVWYFGFRKPSPEGKAKDQAFPRASPGTEAKGNEEVDSVMFERPGMSESLGEKISDEGESIEEGIIRAAGQKPGILQTEIYDMFPGEDRRSLQAILLQMDREKRLRREREGSTYRIFPIS